ncbi:MAG: hypothetical protein JWM05_1307 [Acidimicrobiales bacterium]|nr:hypothetical protein [Acidimicrobiales bacterium]
MLAILGAAALIATALVARSRVFDHHSGGGAKRSSGRPVVACTDDVSSVCQALSDQGLITSAAPLDLAGVADQAGKVDAWLSPGAAPAIAAFDAGATSQADGPIRGTPQPVGTARLAVLIDPAALTGACPVTGLTWRCLATKGAALKEGVGDPATAEGISRLAPLAAGLSPALVYDDVRSTDLHAITDEPNPQQPAADQADLLVTQGPGAVSLVVGPQDLVRRAADTQQGRGRGLAVLLPSPAATITLVLTPTRAGTDLRSVLDALRTGPPADALRALGYGPATTAVVPNQQQAGFLYQVQQKAVR